ncbi:putative toxin-antitoxin system toxin component, PIN family [Larkinella soli]|uniref:putative toxin-antitoxin system toxin component, PIN family n=1 Tax=Larkinella soli TaxID=1770527 RepID=UPI000FFB1CAE|nr:putative toxin-antitoxin system toxin component, PIN family [Larkinella soli]
MPVRRNYLVVIDVNWYISATINERSRRTLFRILTDERFRVVMSPELISEYQMVINRPKMRRYVSIHQAERFLNWLEIKIIRFVPWSKVEVCRDPKDDYLLALSQDCRAHYLISGDPDVCELQGFGSTIILTMKEFYRRFRLK